MLPVGPVESMSTDINYSISRLDSGFIRIHVVPEFVPNKCFDVKTNKYSLLYFYCILTLF